MLPLFTKHNSDKPKKRKQTLDEKREQSAKKEYERQEKLLKKLDRKNSSKLVNTFISDWVELMAQLNIHNQIDKCPSPNYLHTIDKDGAQGIMGKLAFPPGCNFSQVEREEVQKSIQQTMLKGCMFRLLGEKNKMLVDFVAINKWHDIPYSPVLSYPNGAPLKFGDIFLGYDIVGEPVIVNINKCPHPTIFGATGGGKSKLLEMMITNMALTHSPEECHFYFCQISKTDYVKFKRLAHTKAMLIPDASASEIESLYEILNMFKYIQDEICRRQELMKDMLENGDDGNIIAYNKSHPKAKLPLIIVWTDESSDLFASEGAKGDVKEARDAIREYAERLSRTARSFGIFIVNCLQKSTKSQFSTIMKNQSIAKISFAQSTLSESQNAIDSGDAYGLPRYVCALRKFDGSGSDVQFFKTGYAPDWKVLKGFLEEKNLMTSPKLQSFKTMGDVELNQLLENLLNNKNNKRKKETKPSKEEVKSQGELEKLASENELYKNKLKELEQQLKQQKNNPEVTSAPCAPQISNYSPFKTSYDDIEDIVDETDMDIWGTPKI